MKAPYWVVKCGAVYLVAALHSTWATDQRKATKFLNRDHAVAWKGDATRLVRVVPKKRATIKTSTQFYLATRIAVLEAQVRSLQLAQPRGIKHAEKGGAK